ncbi:hypothetical protein L2E82_07172 [Cichorium intybus]|uniref:Uncharacterized protein n=1 Tax=Cichorium intybus TaxID=13427 RepID=A0ACB9G4Z0_CICIN|nr:hypothetical protein L2E82_07172 [Cichorium intybus]
MDPNFLKNGKLERMIFKSAKQKKLTGYWAQVAEDEESAFDGESKLQVLNGNYCIPEMPKYGSSITDLIKVMLQSSMASTPVMDYMDIDQVVEVPDTPE